MKELIISFKPDTILVPSFLDSHPDHVETSKILALSLESIESANPLILSYEIWTPVAPNCLVVIDKYFDDKLEGIAPSLTVGAMIKLLPA
jgi:LmbE family N-acetylglucosaminyl deacetylase